MSNIGLWERRTGQSLLIIPLMDIIDEGKVVENLLCGREAYLAPTHQNINGLLPHLLLFLHIWPICTVTQGLFKA